MDRPATPPSPLSPPRSVRRIVSASTASGRRRYLPTLGPLAAAFLPPPSFRPAAMAPCDFHPVRFGPALPPSVESASASASASEAASATITAAATTAGPLLLPPPPQASLGSSTSIGTLTDLPADVLLSTLGYFTAKELGGTVSFVSSVLRRACNAPPLWRDLCLRTGKLLNLEDEIPSSSSFPDRSGDGSTTSTPSKSWYLSVPCVPVDAPSISAALESIVANGRGGTITVMPGTYEDRIVVDSSQVSKLSGEYLADGGGEDERGGTGGGGSVCIEIRAAFPGLYEGGGGGVTLVHDVRRIVDGPLVSTYSGPVGPTVNISTVVNPFPYPPPTAAEAAATRHVSLTLTSIQIRHSVPGTDIWGSNTAVRVDSPQVSLILRDCTVQSDSGRGVVVTSGASARLSGCTIVDCAATGLYVGDVGTGVRLSGCNVVRNGFGSRRGLVGGGRTAAATAGSGHGASEEESDAAAFALRGGEADADVIPPGHSGCYVEAAETVVEDSLIARNSLTGLSVVRGGQVQISGCDVVDNYAEPITVEDANDLTRAGWGTVAGEPLQGGVEYGLPNNFQSTRDQGSAMSHMWRHSSRGTTE